MIARLVKPVVFVSSIIVVWLTMSLWVATGRAWYTQYFDSARAQREAATTTGLADLFAGTAPEESSALHIQGVPNRFALGLFPSAYPWEIWSPDAVSALTIAGPAGLVALLQLFGPRRRLASKKPPAN